jgi:hypothetical protein
MTMPLLISLLIVSAHADRLVPFPFDVPKNPAMPVAAECDFHKTWPQDMIVYAAGAQEGTQLDWPIDEEGNTPMRIDLAVNSRQPVALILNGAFPTIWNIGWTQRTKIQAVLFTGYYAQLPAGLERSTPVIISAGSGAGNCGFHGPIVRELGKLNELSLHLFGRDVRAVVDIKGGKGTLGEKVGLNEKLVSSDWKSVGSYKDDTIPPVGKKAIEEALKKKQLRKADADEFAEYLSAIRAHKLRSTKLVNFEPPDARDSVQGRSIYAVTGEFKFPKKIHDLRLIILVPKGKPEPDSGGRDAPATDLNLNDNSCVGYECTVWGVK